MKKVLLSLFTILLSVGFSLVTAAESGQIWKDSDANLYSLLQDKYEVVDTDFLSHTTNASRYTEVIYLQKGADLYRCITFKNAKNRFQHECQLCQDPAQ
jgi:uncharacterized protein YxeA